MPDGHYAIQKGGNGGKQKMPQILRKVARNIGLRSTLSLQDMRHFGTQPSYL
jgi:hypothetical protein